MDFRPVSIEERKKLVDALRGNAEDNLAILMDRRDTSFIGTSEEVADDEVIAAIKSVPCHYAPAPASQRTKSMPIELGDVVKDVITGFEGVVIGQTKWLHGCTRLTVQPQDLTKDGKPIEATSFDEPQLVLVKKKAVKTTDGTGGPAPEPARRSDARR